MLIIDKLSDLLGEFVWGNTQKNNSSCNPKNKVTEMSAKKSNSPLSKKLIAVLLTLKILLTGMQAADSIKKGESVTETLIWLINQYIPVLQRISRQADEEKKSDE